MDKTKMINRELTIVAGPCSLGARNVEEIFQISKIEVKNRKGKIQKAVYGTRVVGLKSRTELNEKGKGMGIDYETYLKNLRIFLDQNSLKNLEILPSIRIAQTIIQETSMNIATEIMSPLLQLPLYEKLIPKNKLMIWNPSVSQLGWPILEMSVIAARNNWTIGIKNGKWLGANFKKNAKENNFEMTSMELTWVGLSKYLRNNKFIFIHRGVDIEDKGDYRNIPVHQAAKRIKLATKAKIFFDPSHSFGSKLRNNIVKGTVEAMKFKVKDNYLYDGILIEVGTSETDRDQHITVKELNSLCKEISSFRDLQPPLHP